MERVLLAIGRRYWREEMIAIESTELCYVVYLVVILSKHQRY